MNRDEFNESLGKVFPSSSISPELKSLWHAKKGDWEKAHLIAQDIASSDGSWIHAFLHRWEGDESNARFWYRQAERSMPSITQEEELEMLINYFLSE